MMSGSLSFKKLAYLRSIIWWGRITWILNFWTKKDTTGELVEKKKVESVFIFCIKAQTENERRFCLKKCSKARPALDVCRVCENCADVIGGMGAQNNNIAIYLAFTFWVSVFHNLVS